MHQTHEHPNHKTSTKTAIAHDSSITFLPIETSSGRKKLNRETLQLKYRVIQMEITDIYSILHLTLKNSHMTQQPTGTFCKINHLSTHKASLN